jgi:hypothetical protein
MSSNPIIISRRQNPWARAIAQLARDLGGWLYVAGTLVLVSVLAFVYLGQASYVARQIELMVELEQQIDDLHEANNALLLQIAGHEDMSLIKAEARAMGLGEAKQVEYVVVVLDDATSAVLKGAASGLTTSAANGAPSSVPLLADRVPTTAGLRLASAIAQQFQSWIGSNATAWGAE